MRDELARIRPTNADPLVDLREVPGPKRRLYDAARRGELRATKIGGHWLTRQSDLDAWLVEHDEARRAAPTPEPVVDLDDDIRARLGLVAKGSR